MRLVPWRRVHEQRDRPGLRDVTGDVAARVYSQSHVQPPSVDRTGLKAVKTALELLRAAADPPPQLLIDTLSELGDWYQTTSRPNLALPYYEEAAAVFAAVGQLSTSAQTPSPSTSSAGSFGQGSQTSPAPSPSASS